MCIGCNSNDCWRIFFDICPLNIGKIMCYSKIIDFPLEGENREQTTHQKRGCVARNNCHRGNYTASLPDGRYIRMEVKCCDTRVCNDRVPKQEDHTLNGMQCPGCLTRYSNADQPCVSDTTVSCRGKENKCISYTGRLITPQLYYPRLSFKGCATTNLCDLLMGATQKESDLLKPSDTIEAECSPAKYPIAEEPSPEQEM